jgi:ParB-like chromosome segregation protein Spo0J
LPTRKPAQKGSSPKPDDTARQERRRAHAPVSNVAWLRRADVTANAYNPNRVAPPELELLIVSILADGWTTAVVIRPAEPTDHTVTPWVVVDGEHRWTVAGDPRLVAIYGDYIPVVKISADPVHRMMSTVRHNRARGTHAILPMAEIVRTILADGVAPTEVQKGMGMEHEEVVRLGDRAGMPVRGGERESAGEFGKAWVPAPQDRTHEQRGDGE